MFHKKGIRGNNIYKMTLVAFPVTLYNTHKLAHKDIMVDKLTKERVCVNSAVREDFILQRIKRLPSLSQQSQFTHYPHIDLNKHLTYKLVWLCET